jgi:hypothetical protein
MIKITMMVPELQKIRLVIFLIIRRLMVMLMINYFLRSFDNINF